MFGSPGSLILRVKGSSGILLRGSALSGICSPLAGCSSSFFFSLSTTSPLSFIITESGSVKPLTLGSLLSSSASCLPCTLGSKFSIAA